MQKTVLEIDAMFKNGKWHSGIYTKKFFYFLYDWVIDCDFLTKEQRNILKANIKNGEKIKVIIAKDESAPINNVL